MDKCIILVLIALHNYISCSANSNKPTSKHLFKYIQGLHTQRDIHMHLRVSSTSLLVDFLYSHFLFPFSGTLQTLSNRCKEHMSQVNQPIHKPHPASNSEFPNSVFPLKLSIHKPQRSESEYYSFVVDSSKHKLQVPRMGSNAFSQKLGLQVCRRWDCEENSVTPEA